jgi:phosphoglycerol transferase
LTRLQGYTMNVVDGPDIFGINLAGRSFKVLVALQLLLLLAWAARLRLAPLLFVCIALPAAYLASNQGVHRHLEAHRPASQTDLAAKFVHAHVPPGERSQVVVAGVDLSLMIRAQFHIDHPDTSTMMLDFGPVEEYQLPLNKKWMLLLGDYTVPAHITLVRKTPWYSIVRLPEPEPQLRHVKLSLPPDPKVVTGVEGLSHIEPWGRWSDAKQVVVRFAEPLPRRVGLVLSARAYDVNANQPFKVHLGGDTKEFKVGWHQQEVGLHFDIRDDTRTLVIEVPQPVSPAERGQPGDTRKLGIGIGEITITDATGSVQAAR